MILDPGRFDLGLSGLACRLDRAGAEPDPVPVRRWRDPAGRADRRLLGNCRGPTVDLGCGPGRLVAELTKRGVPALGVDSSRLAVRLCTERGAPALLRDLFAVLPGEGRWHHALLADGNIGIGGDPVALLRRVRRLIAPHGSVVVELAKGAGLWRGSARLVGLDGRSDGWFPWAQVGRDAIGGVAAKSGLRLHHLRGQRRIVAELRPER
ncbi:MAG TPA: class I SAM-dependent methyltransferase [Pseudonocardia sp.]|nr:class I SAM-dependent methyltransferase [Pseudonocardia sp.]